MHLGDCLEVMPTLGKVDAVVTDPPYGIAVARGEWTGVLAEQKAYEGADDWDDEPYWRHIGYPGDLGGQRPSYQRDIALDGSFWDREVHTRRLEALRKKMGG